MLQRHRPNVHRFRAFIRKEVSRQGRARFAPFDGRQRQPARSGARRRRAGQLQRGLPQKHLDPLLGPDHCKTGDDSVLQIQGVGGERQQVGPGANRHHAGLGGRHGRGEVRGLLRQIRTLLEVHHSKRHHDGVEVAQGKDYRMHQPHW